MTEQILDTIQIEGVLWDIESCIGIDDLVPQNESLGLKPIIHTTANWSGRICHYFISEDELYFFKLQMQLDENDVELIPKEMRYEKRIRYEPNMTWSAEGEKPGVWVFNDYFLVFDNLKINYTGEMLLSFPCIDIWEHPVPTHAIKTESEAKQRRKYLEFKNGLLVLNKDI